MARQRMLVIGGDAAGMSAASQARRMQGPEELEIVAFERGPRTSYAACGLPYLVEGLVESPDRLISRTPEEFARRDIEVHVCHEVTGIDTGARTVSVRHVSSGDERTEPWDELVIGTGARGVRPPLPGIETDGVMQLRTIEDGVELDRRIADGARNAVVVGAGYIGLEVAEALSARGLSVTVVELLDSPMAGTLDGDMAELVAAAVRDGGVDLQLGAGVEGFEPGADGSLSGVVVGGRALAADVAVLGLGVQANAELAGAAGIPVGDAGGIVVDERMRTPVDGVWAAGDCVESRHRITGESVVIALGTHANKQGRVLGTNLGGGSATFPGVIGTAITKFGRTEIGRTGVTEEHARRLGIDVVASTARSKTRAGYYPGAEPVRVKLVTRCDDGVLVGAQVVGGEGAGKRIDTLATAIWCGMRVEDLATADLSYAPPMSPVWDPVVFAAGVAARDLWR